MLSIASRAVAVLRQIAHDEVVPCLALQHLGDGVATKWPSGPGGSSAAARRFATSRQTNLQSSESLASGRITTPLAGELIVVEPFSVMFPSSSRLKTDK